MKELVVVLLIMTGSVFSLIASIGIMNMPDLFTRMHAATKAGTLGVGFILCGVAVHFSQTGVTMLVLATIGFIVLTAPIAAHMIGRAAYYTGVPLWKDSVMDELRPEYHKRERDR